MSISKIFEAKPNSIYFYQSNFLSSESGPRLLISRSHLMLSKIRLKGLRLQRNLSDDKSFQLNLNSNEQLPELSIFESVHMKSYAEGWNCTNQVKKPNLYEMLWNNMEEHEQPDLLLRIGRTVFRCYTSILHCYTKYFSSFKQQNQVELNDTKVTAIAFMKLYNWMLKEKVTIMQYDVLHLLCVAEVLNVEELRNQCWTMLDNSSIYTENVAYELYYDAKQYGSMVATTIQQLMLPRIWKFFLTLLATENFLKMETDEVCHWLRANTIGVNSEMEIFYGAVLWVNSKWNERKTKPLRMVMSCVRFGLLPPWFLVSLHTTKHSYDVDRVVKDTKVKELIADGLSLTTAMLFYSKSSAEFDEFLRRGNLKIPMQRKWIVDSNCSYHYYEGSQKLQNISYENFIEYLQLLKSSNKNHWRNIKAASENHWNYMFNLRPNIMALQMK